MKHFLLGTVFGAAAGLVFSCMKDDEGNRPGKPLKAEFDAFKHEANRFNQALQKAKKASQELNEQMPQAERTISDLSDDVEKYSRHIDPTVDKIKQKSDQLNQDFGENNIVK
ncbi:hypothetical protein IMAU30115_00935 [Lactobacillus helveticus]|uniref:hypothetical protein n=1 Tax=Lactobacillus helveticus TaxID=1587 RepID=UPI0015623932|nr:hypothetical protein [Lactobacillus helveticus]MBW8009055.1 hypothetical protein [Lactobacillus helveticus]MBW8018284.1 hypothetical protein [Lactobacillus helveticus]MBW8043740.1 hypothetical protein [Lactobacillus helveticus]MBW8053287.1 hypothetical protein [Lactobacillus helveticus]NRN80806.1 hypothetical protein [Lactobacillus helveticus]